MNNKILTLFLLTAILALTLVSAANLVNVAKGSDFSRLSNLSSFTIQNVYGSNINLSMSYPALQVNDSKGHFATLTLNPASLSLNDFPNANSTIVNVSIAVDSSFVITPKTYTFPAITISSFDAGNSSITDSDNITFSFTQSYCRYGVKGAVEITKLTDEQLDNKNEWEWHPSDNIEITIRVRNNVGDDLDFLVDYGLLDVTSNQFVDIDEDSIDVSVDDGTSEEVTIKFQVPSDSDINPDHQYKFYVKAYEDGNEKNICAERTADENVVIKQETNSISLTGINLPSPSSCGDSIELRAKVSNNGVNDQKKALVRLYSRELGLDLRKVFDKLDSGDDESLLFNFIVPANATDKTYVLTLNTFFRYDSGNSGCSDDSDLECYDKNSFSDLDKDYTANLKLEGCVSVPVVTDNSRITASLESEANAGKEVVVKATLTNPTTSALSYNILISGTESFSTLQSIEPQTLTLTAGKSQDVLITLKANSDASGDYTFNIKAISNGKVKEQPVTITIAPKSSVFSGNLLNSIKSNWIIWVIVLVNVVLIILIIVVAIRISRG